MLDQTLFTEWRSSLELMWPPETQDALAEILATRAGHESLTENERHCIFQAGIALMGALRLLNNPDFLPKTHFTQTAALQLVLYGSFFQIRESVRFPKVESGNAVILKIVQYLQSDRFVELRNALAHQSGDAGDTWWRLCADTQAVKYSTRRLRRDNVDGEIPLNEIIFASDMQWMFYSRVFNVGADQNGT